MRPLAQSIVVACIGALMLASVSAEDHHYATLIVGQWQGPRHVRAFCGDGSFFLDPEPEGRPLGRWKIIGDTLKIRTPGKRAEATERILKLYAIRDDPHRSRWKDIHIPAC